MVLIDHVAGVCSVFVHEPFRRPSQSSVIADPQGDAAYYRGILHELIDLGTALARAIVERATAVEPVANPAEASEAFERVARAVRRSVRLAEYLASPRPVQAGGRRSRRR